MASAIDITKPVTGTPTTASVRANFTAAKTEIEALQAYLSPDGLTLNVGNDTNGGYLSVNGPAAQQKGFYWNTAGTARFSLLTQGAESTGNAGSDLIMGRFSDAGAFIGSALSVQRSSGLVTLFGGLSFGSQLGATTIDLSKHIALYSTTHGIGVTSGRINVVAPSGNVVAVRINNNDQLSVSASFVTASVTLQQTTGALIVGGNAVANAINLDLNAAVNQSRNMRFLTAGGLRWQYFAGGSETGSNTGSDIFYNRYDDAGVYIGTPFSITRSTGVVAAGLANIGGLTVTAGLNFGSVTASSVTDFTKHIALFGTTYGLNVTSSRLNYNVPAGTAHLFVVGGVDMGQVNSFGVLSGNSTLATSAFLTIQTAAAQNRELRFFSGAGQRWGVRTNSTAEGGSSVGSDFNITRYDDAGTLIDNPITVTRSTGITLFGQGVSFGAVNGASNTDLSKHINLHTTGYGFSVTASRLNIVVPSSNGAYFNINGIDRLNVLSNGITATVGYSTNQGVSFTGSASSVTDLSKGVALSSTTYGFCVFGSALNYNAPGSTVHSWYVGGTQLMVSTQFGLQVGNNTFSSSRLDINGTVSNRQVAFWTAGSQRWGLVANNTAEGGSQAGSDFEIRRYNDSNTLIDAPISIVRSTGNVNFAIGMSLIASATGPTIRAGTGAATGTQPSGSLWLRTDGSAGNRLYVSQGGGTWIAVATV